MKMACNHLATIQNTLATPQNTPSTKQRHPANILLRNENLDVDIVFKAQREIVIDDHYRENILFIDKESLCIRTSVLHKPLSAKPHVA